MDQMKEDVSFLDEYAGTGLEAISANEQAIPYLGMVQPDGSAAAEGATLGVWRNSATGEEYGNVVEVIPFAFKTIWSERSSEPPFNTVGRYEPQSIEVTYQKPKGGKGFAKMFNPETGNEIKELYIYAVMLADRPEAGILLFNPSVSSMKICKTWNTQLCSQLLSNGAQAPIFAYRWNLACDLVDNPAKKGAKMTKLVKVQKSSLISKDVFSTYIKPALPRIQQSMLAITDGRTDEGSED